MTSDTIARRVVDAIERGTATQALLDELADIVLGDESVRLALEIRAGGPHAVRRALELATRLLETDLPLPVARG